MVMKTYEYLHNLGVGRVSLTDHLSTNNKLIDQRSQNSIKNIKQNIKGKKKNYRVVCGI